MVKDFLQSGKKPSGLFSAGLYMIPKIFTSIILNKKCSAQEKKALELNSRAYK